MVARRSLVAFIFCTFLTDIVVLHCRISKQCSARAEILHSCNCNYFFSYESRMFMTRYLLFASLAGISLLLSNQISRIVYNQLRLASLTVPSSSFGLGRTNLPLGSRGGKFRGDYESVPKRDSSVRPFVFPYHRVIVLKSRDLTCDEEKLAEIFISGVTALCTNQKASFGNYG